MTTVLNQDQQEQKVAQYKLEKYLVLKQQNKILRDELLGLERDLIQPVKDALMKYEKYLRWGKPIKPSIDIYDIDTEKNIIEYAIDFDDGAGWSDYIKIDVAKLHNLKNEDIKTTRDIQKEIEYAQEKELYFKLKAKYEPNL